MNKINILIYILILLLLAILGYSLYKKQDSIKENLMVGGFEGNSVNPGGVGRYSGGGSGRIPPTTGRWGGGTTPLQPVHSGGSKSSGGPVVTPPGAIHKKRSVPNTYKINSVIPNDVYIYIIDQNQKKYITSTSGLSLTTDLSKAQVFNIANVTNDKTTANVFITKDKKNVLRFFASAQLLTINQLKQMNATNQSQFAIPMISNSKPTLFKNFSLPVSSSTNYNFYSIPINLAKTTPSQGSTTSQGSTSSQGTTTPSQGTASSSQGTASSSQGTTPSPSVQPYSPSPSVSSCRLVCDNSNDLIQVHKSKYVYYL